MAASLALVLVVFLLLLGSREYERVRGKRELARMTAELDETDPGWRLEQIEAAREARLPPPGENSAEVVRDAATLLPPEDPLRLTPRIPECAWHKAPPDPHRPPQDQVDALAEGLRPLGPALMVARQLRDRPRGGVKLDFPRVPAVLAIPHTQNARVLAGALRCDAEAAALTGDPDGAIDRALAVLNAGRAVGDEPFLISQVVRLACRRLAARTAVQVLAWGQPADAPLARLQAGLAAEGREPILGWAVRGERAMWSATFDAMRAGEGYEPRPWKVSGRSPEDRLMFWWRDGALPGDQAMFLDLMTRFERDSRGGPRERIAAADRLEAEVHELYATALNGLLYLGTRHLVPPFKKLVRFEIDGRAELACVCAAIACERFRLRTGRWPADLAELPRDLLGEVPTDPYRAGPLRYRRLTDGVAVYSVGFDGADDGGKFEPAPDQTTGPDVGCRLWDPKGRGLPPVTPPAAPGPE